MTDVPFLVDGRLVVIVLSPVAVEALHRAPLAQKPILITKKRVYMMPDGAYKGPFYTDNHADIVRFLRVLYRQHVMRDLWGDSILARHEPVIAPHFCAPQRNAVFLRMTLVGDQTDPTQWVCVPQTTCRSGATQTFDVVDRESHGVVRLDSMERLRSDAFRRAFGRVIVHMIARFVIGAGDASLINIIGCERRGADSVTAVDIDDNRVCGGVKRKQRRSQDVPDAPTGIHVPTVGKGAVDCARDASSDMAAVAPIAYPSLVHCLFAPGRGPHADEQDAFDAMILENVHTVRRFIRRVQYNLSSAPVGDHGDAWVAPEYARAIGYADMRPGEVPTRHCMILRLDAIKRHLDKLESRRDAQLAM